MAEQPIIVARKSLALEVEPGTHWWCSCVVAVPINPSAMARTKARDSKL